jgi:hypothetical protein
VVTGTAKGIGAAIVTAMAGAGAAVIVNYAGSKAAADRVVGEIVGNGGRAIAIQGDAGEHGCDHAAMWRGEIEGHAVQRDHRHAARFQFLQRGQQVGRAAAPARRLGDQHRVELPRLRERHDLAALDPIELHPRAGFLERAHHLVAGTGGKRGQIPFLAGAGLVGGRDPAVEGGALSQLNSSRRAPHKPQLRQGSLP